MKELLSLLFSPATLVLLSMALMIVPPAPAGRALGEDGVAVSDGPKRPRDGPGRGGAGARLRRWLGRIWPSALSSGGGRIDRLAVAADIALFAACVRAGLSPGTAAGAVAGSTSDESAGVWSDVARLLAVGVDPARAWHRMNGVPGLAELSGITRLSHRSGAAIATGCERVADTLRTEATDSAHAAAERAGVYIALPLAVCFLPGFIVLGLAPVVISLGLELLG